MSQMLSGGLGAGYQSSSQKESGNQTTAKTYSPGQGGLQESVMAFLRSMIPGIASGGLTPNVAAMKTASADAINKESTGVGDRMNRFLAARGLGKSGQSGKVALETELGRESALAANESKFAGLQLDQNNTLLADALKAAFEAMGSSMTYAGKQSGSGWGITGKAGID